MRNDSILESLGDHKYLSASLEEFVDSLDTGSYSGREIQDRVKDNFYSLCRIAPSTSRYLRETHLETLNEMSFKIAQRENISQIHLLSDEKTIIDILPNPNSPTIHDVFFKTVERELEDYFDILEVSIDPLSPNVVYVVALEKSKRDGDFKLGYLIINDEVYGASGRIIVLYKNTFVVLPAKHGTYSSGRYLKTSDSSVQALEMMLLRMREESLGDRFSDTIGLCHIVFSDDTKITCEEYNRIVNNAFISLASRGMAGDIDFSELSLTDQMVEKYGEVVESLIGKYLWRCTAVSDYTLTDVLSKLSDALKEISNELYIDPSLMTELGNTIFSERLLKEIALLKG